MVVQHPNVARIHDAYAAFANGDLAALNDYFAEDVVFHVVGRNQLSADYNGRDAVYEFFGKLMAITDGTFHVDVHAAFADDEHGVALVMVTASRNGRSMKVNGAHVTHLRDGRIVEFWDASTDQYATDEVLGLG